MRLPQSAREQLIFVAYKNNIRVNIFKRIIDIVSDLIVSGEKEKKLTAILSENYSTDECLLNALKEFRYPKYSSLEKEKNDLIKKLENVNFKIDFPEFFEGSEFNIILKCTKNKSKSDLVKVINEMDENLFKKLSEML
jgi:hypothetical protein